MRRNILPVAAAIAAIAIVPAIGLAGQVEHAPASKPNSALKHKVNGLATAIKAIKRAIKNLQKGVAKAQSDIAKLNTGLSTANSNITTLQGDITSINSQLTAGAAALTAINNALQNSTTGLVGLNNARSLIGFVVSNGAVSGSEFTVTHTAAGTYVLSFVNGAGTATDVSKRVVMIQPLPTGGIPIVASSVNCSASTHPCGASDTNGTDELVVTQVPSGVPTDANFQVAAVSG